MIDDIYEDHDSMEISKDHPEYPPDDVFAGDDDNVHARTAALMHDRNAVAWREIEKYRERKALEKFLKDDLYDELDIRSILD